MSIENKPIQSQNKCISDSSILDKYELKLVYFVCHDIRGWVILDFADILIWKFEETGYCANTSNISV